MKSVLIVPSDNTAVGQYRCIMPYSSIESDINFIISNRLEHAWLSENDDDMVSAILMQRPETQIMAQFAKDFRAEGGIVVVESDDDINALPYSNPVYHVHKQEEHKYRVKWFNECVQHANYVHVSTPELKYGDKSVVFYNAIDLDKYKTPMQKNCDVAWQGSPTHADSLEIIKPVINELLIEGIKVSLTSNKKWLETIFKPHPNLTINDTVPFELFHLIPSMAKVNLAPLPDNRFNRAKSELRILQSAAWRVPSVSSDVSAYRRFNKLSNGGNVIVKDRTKDWLKAIHSLLENVSLYDECSEKSFAAVRFNYDLKLINKQRNLWWRKALLKD